MPNTQLQLLNTQRRVLRLRIANHAKAYAMVSAKMLNRMEKLSHEDLKAFLKKNPDVLLDIGGGVLAKVSSRAKGALRNLLGEFKKDVRILGNRGATKAKKTRAAFENKSLAYLKKILSF